MIMLNMLLLSVTVCFIVDISGVMDDIRRLIARFLQRRTGLPVDYRTLKLKPIGCSLCMVWWCCLAYIVLTHNVTLAYVCASAMYSLLSSNISGILLTLKDYLSWLECWLQKLITK